MLDQQKIIEEYSVFSFFFLKKITKGIAESGRDETICLEVILEERARKNRK